MKTSVLLLMVLFSLPFAVLVPSPQEQDTPKKQEQITPQQDETAVQRRDFMRTKLMYTQNIFEGLTTRDFELIRQGIAEVEQVTEAQEWIAIDSDAYRRLTSEFNSAVEKLKAAAESENVDAIALRFYDVSTRCIDCHQHLQKARYQY
jgi:hypothetical protein